MLRIDVVRKDDLGTGNFTRGITRSRAFDDDMVLASRSRIAAGVASDWHHHGARRLYGYLVSGRLRFEYGRRGQEGVDLTPGDFFRIPPGLVHRDVNLDKDREVIVAGFLVGPGPAFVNVSGPEGGDA